MDHLFIIYFCEVWNDSGVITFLFRGFSDTPQSEVFVYMCAF